MFKEHVLFKQQVIKVTLFSRIQWDWISIKTVVQPMGITCTETWLKTLELAAHLEHRGLGPTPEVWARVAFRQVGYKM